MRRAVAAGVVSIALVVGGATAAEAATPPASAKSLCEGGRVVNRANDATVKFVGASGEGNSVTGGPGVTLNISKTKTFSVSGSITASTGFSAGAVVASVKADVGVTIGASYSGTTSNSGSWKVPSNWKIGRLSIGSLKHTGTAAQYRENRACQLVQISGTAFYNAPERNWSFSGTRVS